MPLSGSFLYTYDIINNKIYKYCLCIVDVASRFKWAVPLTDKTSSSVAKAFKKFIVIPSALLFGQNY